MSREIRGTVVLHVAEDGSYDLRAWGAEDVMVLWVDERCQGDRVYEQTAREIEMSDLRDLIGDSPIGHVGDGKLDEQTTQAIRAAAWKLGGKRLSVVEPE